MKYLDHFRERAVFKNVDHAKTYFMKNLDDLTEIVRVLDEDIPYKCSWRHNTSIGEYVFTTITQGKVYDLNLFTGILLKNKCELIGLPDVVKANPMYRTIFDNDRDLEVYP